MKKAFLILFLNIFIVFNGVSQTAGSLTFSFTPVSHTGYSGTKNVLAVWIRTNSGDFVKTRLRYVGWGTTDHLPTWATNAGGASFNAMLGCDVVDAITGATLTDFTTKFVTWDGTNSSGDIVTDGTYKVCILSTWDHGSDGTVYEEYTFTKGPDNDVQTPADDANFTDLTLKWEATLAIHESVLAPVFTIYPNPTAGMLHIKYKNIENIKVIDMLGKTIYSKKFSNSIEGNQTFDLSNLTKGTYQVVLINDDKTIVKKIVLQ